MVYKDGPRVYACQNCRTHLTFASISRLLLLTFGEVQVIAYAFVVLIGIGVARLSPFVLIMVVVVMTSLPLARSLRLLPLLR
jgi:hypothetical protein